MLIAPAFWARDGLLARGLSPLSKVGAAITARRIAQAGWQAPVPVICCGNATVGGAGKTTLVVDLAQRLSERGVHILVRGYGGSSRRTRQVQVDDSASLVGDEALLLAQMAPTWIGGDRATSAKAAVQMGARVLLMDDGLQNPRLAKSASILVVDGRTGFGNKRVLPAGPLREPVASAAARCHVAVLIGPDEANAMISLPPSLPVLRADLEQDQSVANLTGRAVVAFAGIALPEKFFAPLRRAGAKLVAARSFPDHHAYTRRDLEWLVRKASAATAILVTTPKDAVRLPQSFRAKVTVVGVGLVWQDARQIDQFLEKVVVEPPQIVR